MREITLVEAMKEAFIEEMHADESVYLIGQDIRGGIFPHTEGLVDVFGEDRIVDTPISECGMFGCAMGSAQAGYRPIVDFMFGGFAYVPGSEILHHMAQHYFLHGGQKSLPMVITGAVGTGQRLANEHCMLPTGTFVHQPGIKYVFASTPYDAKGLMKAAIRDDNPVFCFWHMVMMTDKGPVPEEDYTIPIGFAEVKREGNDVTVLANGLQFRHALEVADKLDGEISVEIVDPRSFKPLDIETILGSLEKTNRIVIVDEDFEFGGFAAEVAAQVVDQGFDLLDAPIRRVCIDNVPVPGGYMEPTVCPTPEKIEAAIRGVCQ